MLLLGASLLLLGALVFVTQPTSSAKEPETNELDIQLPRESLKTPFKDEQPISFMTRSQNAAEWDKLPKFWNETTEKAVDPKTGQPVERKAVKIKVPLGLTQVPQVPVENPMTVAKWELGKKLYFDGVLSSDGKVSCATCHDPAKGFTDQAPFSTGIFSKKGGMSAPSVMNSVYNPLQFWDGRAHSLEDQCQGPPQNPVEMFDGKGNAWNKCIERIRKNPDYVKAFREVFGHEPTRDAVAKAIATYERTVLIGNSIHDRAEIAMRDRVEKAETGKFEFKPVDYEIVLKDAFTKKDKNALTALGLDIDKDAGKVSEVAAQIERGRALYFGKARCNGCHVGDNFTDNTFHNLGVGVKDGEIPPGRYGAQAVGHKNPDFVGAFKTPTVRGLLSTAPYMHDGSELTLEKVIDFYDKGGNANEYLDLKMRDYDAEKAYLQGKKNPDPKAPEVKKFGKDQKPIIPLQLKLTDAEKKELILFLKALQGDPVDPKVATK